MTRKKQKKSNKQNQGFTLIEILVSLSIVVVMTGLFLANYHDGSQQASLNSAANQLISDIRLVENFTLGAKKNDGAVPLGGWGIFLKNNGGTNPSQYIIYADIDNYHEYSGADTIYKTVELPNGVIIDTKSNNGLVVNGTKRNDLSLSFLPPDPTVYINTTPAESEPLLTHGQASIKLVNPAGKSKTIQVNFLGMVELVN